ncbi:MAG: aminotransferase class I/II-fold pyridoxal phosphate-dependent enzyme [Bacteroidetes bacterium]|nr:MAG: aminotransferase class I/II-fold pyridoxal phosphate-dependent enzyme [Bacteroidota bacterium]
MSELSKIWLSSPHMGGTEKNYVNEAFDTNWVAPLGPNVDNFEKDICAFTGSSHAAVLSSGTSAIHLALIQLGVGPGDRVICQSFTFSASANPIAYQGGIPVFIDSEVDSWNMDPNALEESIKALIAKGKKPKAIIPVHLYGMPAKMDAIMSIANRYEIPVIEDAAEALGSTYENKACGTFGDFGILSFNGNKIITTSGGGALLSENEEWIKMARFRATQARDNAPHYQHSHIGYNYRMSNIVAGIGRGQMEVLPHRVAQRRANYSRYTERYGDVPGFHFQPDLPGAFSNRWLTSLTIDPHKAGFSREDLRLAMDAVNIESRPLWKPMHMQPVFKDAPYFGGKTAEKLFENGLCLPSGSNLSDDDFNRIFRVLDKTLSR